MRHIVVGALLQRAIPTFQQRAGRQLLDTTEHRMRRRHPADAQKSVNTIDVEFEASPFYVQQMSKAIRKGDSISVATHISARNAELVSRNNDHASSPIQYYST